MGVVIRGCSEIKWYIGYVEVNWRFCTLWGGWLEREGMVIMRACGRVEQRINSKLSECLTGDVDLVPIQQG
jgi:hypothetical protein